MKVHLVRIGNSRGIRIPKAFLQQCELSEEVELEIEGKQLVVRPAARVRRGWSNAFRRMHAKGDDSLTDKERVPGTRWERSEWQW